MTYNQNHRLRKINLYLPEMPRTTYRQSMPIPPGAAFTLGLFLGLMLPLWIKILTK